MTDLHRIMVVEGEGGEPWLSQLAMATHQPWDEEAVRAFPGWVVLNASGDSLQAMLGPCFRHRRTFALTGLQCLSEEEARKVHATARKRKSRSVVLGGWRLLPMVATAKEILSGGCLGTLETLTWNSPQNKGWQGRALAHDTTSWLLDENSRVELTLQEKTKGELTVEARGTGGFLSGQCTPDGAGWLEYAIAGHERRRTFGAVDVRRMELGVMACLGVTEQFLPGLVPCAKIWGWAETEVQKSVNKCQVGL